MSAQFHPGVTNCGGVMAASGCGCARSYTTEVADVDLMAGFVPASDKTMSEDEQTVREWMPAASDKAFARLAGEASTWVSVTADNAYEGHRHEPDWHAVRNSHVAVCLARTPHRELPALLLEEIRDRQVTDLGPGADDRAKVYAAAARTFYTHVPERLGSPTTANEARGMWQGVQRGSDMDGRGRLFPKFTDPNQPGDPVADPEAVRFAVEDTECAALAIEALRNGFRSNVRGTGQFVLQMAASPNRDVRALVADATEWNSDLVDVFARDEDPKVRATVAGRLGALKRDLERETEIHDRTYAVPDQSPETRAHRDRLSATSQRLANDPDTDVRRALATSTRWADEKTQRVLAADRDPMVRHVLATNAKKSGLDEKAIKTLAKDPKPGVRESLLTSGALMHVRTMRRLARDPDPAVAGLAAGRLRPGAAVTRTADADLFIEDGRIQRAG